MGIPLNSAIMSVAAAPGTGAITLGSAISGFQSFAAAGAVDGGTYTYRVDDGGSFAIEQGTYTASGTKLSRGLTYSSTGTALSLSSAAIVTCVASAADLTGVAAGGFNNLKIAPGATTASQVSVSADAVLLRSTGGNFLARSIAITISTGTSGANGLDTGSLAASTWYAIWVISNGSVAAGLISTSATAPTLPSGYAYAARVGWARTNASKNLVPIVQNGRQARFQNVSGQSASPYLSIVSGAVGDPSAPTYVSVAASNFCPTTAAVIYCMTWSNNSSYTTVIVAPNANYGGYAALATASAPAPPVTSGNSYSVTELLVQPLLLETSNVYVACQQYAGAVCIGWEDNL